MRDGGLLRSDQRKVSEEKRDEMLPFRSSFFILSFNIVLSFIIPYFFTVSFPSFSHSFITFHILSLYTPTYSQIYLRIYTFSSLLIPTPLFFFLSSSPLFLYFYSVPVSPTFFINLSSVIFILIWHSALLIRVMKRHTCLPVAAEIGCF